MKVLSLILSIIVFFVSVYFFIIDFRLSSESNYLIYMSTLLILMSICVVGMLINIPLIRQERRRMNYLLYSTYANKNFLKKKRNLHYKSQNA